MGMIFMFLMCKSCDTTVMINWWHCWHCRCNCPEQDPKQYSCNKLIIKSCLLLQDFSLFVWQSSESLKAVLQFEHPLSSTNDKHFLDNEVARLSNSFFYLTKQLKPSPSKRSL